MRDGGCGPLTQLPWSHAVFWVERYQNLLEGAETKHLDNRTAAPLSLHVSFFV